VYLYSRNVNCEEAYYPFDAPYCCHMGTAIKHPVPDRVEP